MDRKPRVLVVDDLQEWQEHLVEALSDDGFYADSAPTADQAFKRLDEELFHILVLDIRLSDADHTNVDGIQMLSRLQDRHWNDAMKVIMLTAFGTKEQMRFAFKDHDVADFVSKDQFNKPSFLENVQQVLNEMRINLALEAQWEQALGAEQVARFLEGNGSAVKHTATFRRLLATELDDLLCRLFHTAQGVVLKPFTPGHSGRGILQALPYYSPNGSGRQVIVKFGHLQTILQERENFTKFVAPYVGGGHSTIMLDLRSTPHLGGIIYSLLGYTDNKLEDFASFYHHADILEIKDALSRLFLDTCSTWYASPGRLQPYNLTTEYIQLFGLNLNYLERVVTEMRSVKVKNILVFTSLNKIRAFINPLLAMKETFIFSTYECITHGDFNPQNLLIDALGNMWLVDFQRTGPGHILRDIAILDTALRIQLLGPEDATLDERLTLEELLSIAEQFDQVEEVENSLPEKNDALVKVYSTVMYLRSLAGQLVRWQRNIDMNEYHVALLYSALNMLSFSSLSSVQREHALLSASLSASKLGLET